MENQMVQKFLSMVKADKALEAELQKEMLNAGSPAAALEKAVNLAKGRGLQLTSDDLKAQLPQISVPSSAKNAELDEKELELVSGGMMNWAKACTGSTSIYCYICAMGTSG